MARDSKQSRKASKDSGETEGRHKPRKRRKGKDDGPGTRKEQPTTTSQETAAEALAAAEAELIQRYPDRKIKAGSLLPAGAVKEFGPKRTVVICCAECSAERRVATSDVFHVTKCVRCSKKPKKDDDGSAERTPPAKPQAEG